MTKRFLISILIIGLVNILFIKCNNDVSKNNSTQPVGSSEKEKSKNDQFREKLIGRFVRDKENDEDINYAMELELLSDSSFEFVMDIVERIDNGELNGTTTYERRVFSGTWTVYDNVLQLEAQNLETTPGTDEDYRNGQVESFNKDSEFKIQSISDKKLVYTDTDGYKFIFIRKK